MNNVYQVRDYARTPVDIEAECLIVAGPTVASSMSAITVVDLSIGGCRVRAGPGYLSDGCEVAIRFGDLATVRGLVCWSTELDIGVRFDERLSPALLQQLTDHPRPRRGMRSVA